MSSCKSWPPCNTAKQKLPAQQARCLKRSGCKGRERRSNDQILPKLLDRFVTGVPRCKATISPCPFSYGRIVQHGYRISCMVYARTLVRTDTVHMVNEQFVRSMGGCKYKNRIRDFAARYAQAVVRVSPTNYKYSPKSRCLAMCLSNGNAHPDLCKSVTYTQDDNAKHCGSGQEAKTKTPNPTKRRHQRCTPNSKVTVGWNQDVATVEPGAKVSFGTQTVTVASLAQASLMPRENK